MSHVPSQGFVPAPGPMFAGVAIVDATGKLGEFDKVYPDAFVGEKSATAIPQGLAFSGKTYAQAAEEWAVKQIYRKTKVRIGNIPKATAVIPESGPSRPMPDVAAIQGIRRFYFQIDERHPDLKRYVESQLSRLRSELPDYAFPTSFGT